MLKLSGIFAVYALTCLQHPSNAGLKSEAIGGCLCSRDLLEPLLRLSTSRPLGSTEGVMGAKEVEAYPV